MVRFRISLASAAPSSNASLNARTAATGFLRVKPEAILNGVSTVKGRPPRDTCPALHLPARETATGCGTTCTGRLVWRRKASAVKRLGAQISWT